MSGGERSRPIAALHVGKYLPPFSGGMETFLLDLLHSLISDGVDASVIVHEHRPRSGDLPQAEPATLAALSGSVSAAGRMRIYRVPSFGRVLYAPVSPKFLSWLRRAIKTERPDILHLHLPNTSAFWALLLPEARRIPWIVHWHADVVSSDADRRLKLAYPLYRPIEQRLLRRASGVIVTSPSYLENSRPLSRWRDKCCVVALGLDLSRIPDTAPKRRAEVGEWWGDAAFRILSVGRLTYYKGHEYLVRALRDLPGARALIVGGGNQRQFLEGISAELNLDGRVILTGELPENDLHALMETCDCLCLPSIERTEAFGVVLLEAMAHGKPAVVSDVRGSGMSWVVQDGSTGLVVPPAQPEALRDAFLSLANDRETLSRMGRAGRRRFQDMFRIERVSGEILRLYRQLNDGGVPARDK